MNTAAYRAASALSATLRASGEESEQTRGYLISNGLATVSPYPQVMAFHVLYGLPAPVSFTQLSVTDHERRLRLHLEEFLELVDACGFQLTVALPTGDQLAIEKNDLRVNHVEGKLADYPKIIDALCDCTVVDYGHAIEMGINLEDPMIETHASNCTKLGEDGLPIINGPVATDRVDNDGNPIEVLMRPDAPIGKVLKGPNFIEPDYIRLITPNV